MGKESRLAQSTLYRLVIAGSIGLVSRYWEMRPT